MLISVLPRKNDDVRFMQILEQVVTGLVEWQSPQELFIIRINNWFDHKWLNYAGRGIVPLNWGGGRGIPEVALDEFHRDYHVFPPFSPNRVLWEYHFKQTDSGYEEQIPIRRYVHKRVLQHASQNFQRRVADFSPSAIFVWYSSNTTINEYASLLSYMVQNQAVASWYASLKKNQNWRLMLTKGIPKRVFGNSG